MDAEAFTLNVELILRILVVYTSTTQSIKPESHSGR